MPMDRQSSAILRDSESAENMILTNHCTAKPRSWHSGMTITEVCHDRASHVSKLLTGLSAGASVERSLGLALTCVARSESPRESPLNAVGRLAMPAGPWFVRWCSGGVSLLDLESTLHCRDVWLRRNPRGLEMLQTGTFV